MVPVMVVPGVGNLADGAPPPPMRKELASENSAIAVSAFCWSRCGEDPVAVRPGVLDEAGEAAVSGPLVAGLLFRRSGAPGGEVGAAGFEPGAPLAVGLVVGGQERPVRRIGLGIERYE